MTGYCMIYGTAPSKEAALVIVRALVKEKLVACANVMEGAISIYRWQGNVEETQEAVFIAKTRKALAAPALERIKVLHSYEVPCAVVYDMAGGFAPYLDWIGAETA